MPLIRNPPIVDAANVPAPTWTKIRSSGGPTTFSSKCAAISQPIVRPPSRHHTFSVPCTVNGMAPAATASRNRWMHGSPAGSAGRRGHSTISARSSASRASTTGSALRRHEDPNRPLHRGRQRGRRDTRRCRTTRSPVAVDRPHGSTARDPATRRSTGAAGSSKRCRALWLPGNLPGLVLDPHAAIDPEARARR